MSVLKISGVAITFIHMIGHFLNLLFVVPRSFELLDWKLSEIAEVTKRYKKTSSGMELFHGDIYVVRIAKT